jgi:glycosyl transferase family 25
VDEGLPYAVVLEDDLVYEKEFAQVIGALPALAGMVDLVKLGQPEVRDRKFRTVRALTGVSSLVRFKRTVNGTQGYFVTAAGAAKFLRYSRRIAYPVDVAINRVWENGLNIYGVQPWPVIHDEASPTSIEGARFERAAQPYVGVKLERRLRKAWDSLAKRLYFVTTRRRDEQVAAGGPGPETAQELARAA